MRHYIGVDLGLASEPTAIVVVESSALEVVRWNKRLVDDMIHVDPVFRSADGSETFEQGPISYSLRHIDRVSAGTPYAEIVERVKGLKRQLRDVQLVMDVTGVGTAVTDLFRNAGLYQTTVTITGAGEVTDNAGDCRVPKRELLAVAQVLLQMGTLRIAKGVPYADLLVKELKNFKARITPEKSRESYLDWREAENDDLVLALCVALWQAHRTGGGAASGMAYGAPGPFDLPPGSSPLDDDGFIDLGGY